MSKGLEALEEIKSYPIELHIKEGWDISLYEEQKEQCDIIEKCLKALEIIKNKCASNTNLWLVVCTRNYEDYESFVENKDHKLVRIEHNILTQEEFNLLKGVLEE